MRLLLLFFCITSTSNAQAHRFAPSLLQVEQLTTSDYTFRWKTPIQSVSVTPVSPILPDDCVTVERSPWIQEGTGRIQQTIARCRSPNLQGSTIRIEGLGENQTSAVLLIKLREGEQLQTVLTSKQPSYTIDSTTTASTIASRYLMLGLSHIARGVDHLLFVLGVFLLVGSGRNLVWTITAFTVGHSITLAAVTLGSFHYPVSLVEFAIGVSVFFLAYELTRAPEQSLLRAHPWWIAGIFGLLHGMGFAGALSKAGLPIDNIPFALLCFNFGIELGQIAFVIALAILAKLAHTAALGLVQPARQTAVLALGVLSAHWCIERGAVLFT
ncbi:MAG: HupE/UreJ family protein [Pseudomonadota bacterium]